MRDMEPMVVDDTAEARVEQRRVTVRLIRGCLNKQVAADSGIGVIGAGHSLTVRVANEAGDVKRLRTNVDTGETRKDRRENVPAAQPAKYYKVQG